ncbi:MAG: PIG-L family deacetylase, partial [Bacteroidia bacterium]|nr:PIG-L family deacetylase [Bacteroidia bacterium]
MKKTVFTTLLTIIFFHPFAFSQLYKAYSSGEIDLAFKKLTHTASVLYIAAHPDDENTRLISWLVNEKCVRTGYLSLTRGDGGQNLIGSEQGIELGIIRSRELIAARSVDGAEQFFTRAYDFGYSKSPEETFQKWNREEILSDVVYVIRKFRPDIIITRFATDGSGGHGHHTASAMLAEEAFEAAGDPSRFPKQLKTVNIWKPKRLFYNSAARFWNPQADMSQHILEDVGGFNKALGKSYGEISAESRSMHKSQGFGSTRQRGEMLEYFKPIKGDTNELKSIFDRIDISASSLPIAKKRKQYILQAQSLYKDNKIEACTQKLLAALSLQAQHREEDYDYKYQLLVQTILRVNGVFLEANAESSATVSLGDSLKIKFTGINRSSTPVKLQQWQLQAFGSDQNCPTNVLEETPNLPLENNKAYQKNMSFLVCQNMPASHLYWLNQNLEDNKFSSKQEDIGIDNKLVS